MEALVGTLAFITALIAAAVWLWKQLKRAPERVEEARPLDIPDTRALHIEVHCSGTNDHHHPD